MATENIDQLAERYAAELQSAAFQDRLARVVAEALVKDKKKIPVVSNIVAAMGNIEDDIASRVYAGTEKPLSDEDKERIYKAIAEKLGLDRPEKLKKLIKEASIDNALVVIQDAQDIIDKIKK
jgi:DNA-binding ferritin-like protein